MTHKLLEKIDDIVADNRITEDEYVIICNLLKSVHETSSHATDGAARGLINDLREEIEFLQDERNHTLHDLTRLYKSQKIMWDLNRELNKNLKELRTKSKRDIADRIIEISHLKKEVKELSHGKNPHGAHLQEGLTVTHSHCVLPKEGSSSALRASEGEEVTPPVVENENYVNCCCGSTIKRSGYHRHLKTKKHLAYIGNL